ncbi:tRNA ligase [Candidatus Falkowbacteria bacterium CG10_big_fil_rev_8_21_14_0_10_44_15]|uniref:tRNA ligase n=1 Tax=Candidatus Falkowbacteria bacterium CG10_big_fil_rev_8_21_14_0_10_44_15 TaxID=1974569 RepID=A0A2H0V2S8_9BACT|nr:MAG: tRNA ligase [Candidatus Falkowbacteria bacterium CG10_big_fil_rev_8_21_14_0_10_44_15]
MRELQFSVTPEVLNLGVKIITARISDIHNTSENSDFELYKTAELEHIRNDLAQKFAGKKYNDDPILAGFRDLHTKIGRSNRDYVASPENLRRQFLERGRFPHINTVVDIYNLVSLQAGLALGAHDIEKINGNITLRLTSGSEVFVPLGKIEPEKVFPSEYAYIDDLNNIICRLEVLQVNPTKVTTESSDLFIIIQGNSATAADYLRQGAEKVCQLITKYCGGSYLFLNKT